MPYNNHEHASEVRDGSWFQFKRNIGALVKGCICSRLKGACLTTKKEGEGRVLEKSWGFGDFDEGRTVQPWRSRYYSEGESQSGILPLSSISKEESISCGQIVGELEYCWRA